MNVEETLARWGEGKEAWNTWAEEVLAKKERLKEAGLWSADWFGEGQNAETRAWLEEAQADFSAQEFPEDVYFGDYIFPGPVVFSGAAFFGAAIFKGARFLSAVRFEQTKFSGAASFSEAVIEGLAVFDGAEFGAQADFEKARFLLDGGGPLSASARFQRTQFRGKSEFRCAEFSGNAEFTKAKFADSARFDEAQFKSAANFEGSRFAGVAGFNQAVFGGSATFVEVKFAKEARFTDTQFSGVASFERAEFAGDVSFKAARFGGEAAFSRARFGEEARFPEAQFVGGADFSRVRFDSTVSFDDVRFGDSAHFTKGRFKGDVGFRRTEFIGRARFTEARFTAPAFFMDSNFADDAAFQSIRSEVAFVMSGARFAIVPSFHEATFHQPPRLDYMHVEQQLQRRREWAESGHTDPRPWMLRWMGVARDEHVSSRFRQLRRMAGDARDHEREHEYFAQEIRSSRFWYDKPIGRGGAKFWLGWIYGGFSDFGRSMLRPMLVWFALVFLFALYYLGQREGEAVPQTLPAIFPAWPDHPNFMKILNWVGDLFVWLFEAIVNLYTSGGCFVGDSGATAEALYLSFKNAFFFLQWESAEAAHRVYGCLYGVRGEDAVVPLSVSVGAVVQNVLSLSLLFLFLMALRNLLKVK